MSNTITYVKYNNLCQMQLFMSTIKYLNSKIIYVNYMYNITYVKYHHLCQILFMSYLCQIQNKLCQIQNNFKMSNTK